ncbi:MAG: FkbM family methyltransferase [Bacteroidota bacterium]
MFLRFLRSAGRELNILTSRKTRVRKAIDCRSEWYGDRGSGFFLFPDLLNKTAIVYSFGIRQNISFETAIINQHASHVFAFDATRGSILWVEKQVLPPAFNFHPFGLNKRNGTVNFKIPGNKQLLSARFANQPFVAERLPIPVSVKSFTDITLQFEHKQIDILKIDLDGSEYEVLDSILTSRIEVVQLLIKINEKRFADGKTRTKKLFASLKEHGYEIFAVSNDMEKLSFIKTKYLLHYNLMQ